MGVLIFVDTNILLDFYRAIGRDDLSILNNLTNNQDKIITTVQVEMEFKNNRQRVIKDSIGRIKMPDGRPDIPAFLKDQSKDRELSAAIKEAAQLVAKIRERTEVLLADPEVSDPVFQRLQRLFKYPGQYHLSDRHPDWPEVKQAAEERFRLGYPPRKGNDLCYGDAINWEWILRCAQKSGDGIVVVSRDGDYGLTRAKRPMLNDWLRHEFDERVGPNRVITLTTHLTDAFKQASIPVTKDQEEAEDRFLTHRSLAKEWTIASVLADIESRYSQDLVDLKSILAATEPRDRDGIWWETLRTYLSREDDDVNGEDDDDGSKCE